MADVFGIPADRELRHRCSSLRYSICAIAGLSLFSSRMCMAGPPTQEAVQAWFVETWESARSPLSFSGLEIEWRTEIHWVPPPAELNRLRDEVSVAHDHPERELLRQYHMRLAGVPTAVDRVVWMSGKDQWRINETNVADSKAYWDQVVTKQHIWGMTSTALDIIPITGEDPGYDYRSRFDGILNDVRELRTGGLVHFALPTTPTPHVTVKGTSWEANVESHLVGSAVILGTWDDVAERGFIREIRITGGPRAAMKPQVFHSFDWQYHAELDEWLAGRVTTTRLQPERLDRVVAFRGTKPQPEGWFADITELPSFDGSDPIRGPVTFTAVTDMRHEKRLFASQGPDGVTETPIPPSPLASNRSRLLWTGWALAPLLAVALIAVRVWRYARSKRPVGV